MIDLPMWIQTALSALGGTSIVGGIVIATVKAWSKRGESRAREVEAREASATAVVKPLIDRLEAQDKRIDAQGEEIEKLRKDREKDRRDLDDCHRKHEECEGETRRQAQQIEEQGKVIAELQLMIARSREDITQRIELAAEKVVRRKSDPAIRAEANTSPETPSAKAMGQLDPRSRQRPMARREIPPPLPKRSDR